MFDKRLVCTGIAVVAVVVAAVFISRIPQAPASSAEMLGTVSGVEKSQSSTDRPKEEETGYLVKTHNGRLAVFLPGESKPEMELDVLVKYLPDYDQALLEQGIPVANYSALVALIEDYSS